MKSTVLAAMAVAFLAGSVAAEDTAFVNPFGNPCETAEYSVLVSVQGVRESKGLVTADVYVEDEDNPLSDGRVGRGRVPAVAETTELCVPIDGPGEYTVAVYHDENANKKFDKTWIGLPDEPFGLSRNPKIGLSRPKWDETKIDVDGPRVKVDIILKRL